MYGEIIGTRRNGQHRCCSSRRRCHHPGGQNEHCCRRRRGSCPAILTTNIFERIWKFIRIKCRRNLWYRHLECGRCWRHHLTSHNTHRRHHRRPESFIAVGIVDASTKSSSSTGWDNYPYIASNTSVRRAKPFSVGIVNKIVASGTACQHIIREVYITRIWCARRAP